MNFHFVLFYCALFAQVPQTIKQFDRGWEFKAFDDETIAHLEQEFHVKHVGGTLANVGVKEG